MASNDAAQLSDRDRSVLCWVGEQYEVRSDVLARLAAREAGRSKAVSRERVRQLVGRWESAGLVQQRRILHGLPSVVWLSAAGLRQCGLPYRYHTPRIDQLWHTHFVALARLYAERSWATGRWQSERDLHHALGRDRKERHVPDGVWWQDGVATAVEVERARKSDRRIGEIFAELRACYPQVWYVAVSPLVADAVLRVVEGDPAVHVSLAGQLEER
ncbi:MAG: hypothetical protein M0Z69_14655 [Actinomycetota bacterium]|nr:hypothetical protein [Actinomycetota bacterium]